MRHFFLEKAKKKLVAFASKKVEDIVIVFLEMTKKVKGNRRGRIALKDVVMLLAMLGGIENVAEKLAAQLL